jgi:lipopolysaccharide export LptBFGC system permease protein LptF
LGQESGSSGIGWDGRSDDGELKMAIPAEMDRRLAVVLYVVAMAAIIVGVDFVFFRNRFWERLTVNIGIVLVFAAFYLRFLRRP